MIFPQGNSSSVSSTNTVDYYVTACSNKKDIVTESSVLYFNRSFIVKGRLLVVLISPWNKKKGDYI